jgi:hypothetical protein
MSSKDSKRQSEKNQGARKFWLSFCDNERPKGSRFLGACIVDVTAENADKARGLVEERYPHHAFGAEWIAAASREAWRLGCNPGGQMLSLDVTDAPEAAGWPVGVLMSLAEIEARGPVIRATAFLGEEGAPS